MSLAAKDNSLASPGSSVFDLPTQPGQGGGAVHNASMSSNVALRLEGHPPGELQVPDDSPSFVVVSGGTGCNSICSAFGNATYVLPVSDDGGSSSEIIRVLGGPSIGVCACVMHALNGTRVSQPTVSAGDIRSRLIRLIPSSPSGSPLDRIRNLLAYRLPARCSEREARDEWRDIVEGRSSLWTGIPNDRKEAIRGDYYVDNAIHLGQC